MSAPTGAGGLERALSWLHRLEDAVLALLLGAMVLLAPLQIFLRLFFDEGLTWADPLLRVLVLWVGLFGAISASRDDRHITVDVLSFLFRGRLRAFVRGAVHVFTALVCGVLCFQSWRFVQSEREYGSVAFLDLPAWWLQAILPFAFATIALRYALHAAGDTAVLLGWRAPEAPRPGGAGA